jgi:hypothetical protein
MQYSISLALSRILPTREPGAGATHKPIQRSFRLAETPVLLPESADSAARPANGSMTHGLPAPPPQVPSPKAR